MKTLVSVGSSPFSDYSFLMPITALLWREVLDMDFRALFVGSEDEWRSVGVRQGNNYPNGTKAVIEAFDVLVKEGGVSYTFVPRFEGPIGEYNDGTIAQSIRYHVVADPTIDDDTYMMVSDADIWPLQTAFYKLHYKYPEFKAASYYSNGDHFEGKEISLKKYAARLPIQCIPTCHVVMRAKEWRKTYEIPRISSISSTTIDAGAISKAIAVNTKRTLDRYINDFILHFHGQDRGFAIWMADQYILTERLCNQDFFPNETLFVTRRGHPPVDRLDRGNELDWYVPFEKNKERWVDAHVLKSPAEDKNWKLFLPIIDTLLPKHSKWLKEYREKFIAVSR